tara:strand:- start:201 stop:689 length:489 start_codon:yes stop_codon:yes gene_type:complete
MAIINVSAGSEAVLVLGQDATNANIVTSPTAGLVVPRMSDITINNSTGVFRFKTLDNTAESAVTTPATNQLTLNVIVDSDAFFGNSSLTDTVAVSGLFGASKNKTRVFFNVGFEGNDATSKYLTGSGFISGLAPTVNMDSPVWVTPVTIEVDGDFTQATVGV